MPVRGDELVELDEHPRPDASLEALGAAAAGDGPQRPRGDGHGRQRQRPERRRRRSASSPTAEKAAELGLRPLGRLVSWAVAGVPPATMGIGPVPATERALELAGLALGDMDLIELNEAFAAQVLAVLREWELPDGLERVNVNGSGISLGHPVGATGARILATLLREMDRREARYGLETMCIGGGQGLAAVFERPCRVGRARGAATGPSRGRR